MRRQTGLWLSGFLGLFASVALAQDSINPEKIVYRHLEAIGGKNALKSVKTVIRKGKISMGPQGPEIPFDRYAKRPNRARRDVEFQGAHIILATDGTKAWQINPMAGATAAAEMLPPFAEFFMRSAYMDDIYFENMETRGVKLAYVAKEEEEGHSLHHVLVTFGDGHQQHRYYDANSGLLTKMSQAQPTPTGQAEITTRFLDWKSYNGLKYPTRMELSSGQTLTFESTQVNVALADSFFEMPDPASE